MDSDELAKPHEIASEEHLLQKCKSFEVNLESGSRQNIQRT
jgi:hypothetical protein